MSTSPTIGVVVPAYMPPMYSTLGPVTVAGLWGGHNPTFHPWRKRKPPTPQRWKTTQLPGPHSGRF